MRTASRWRGGRWRVIVGMILGGILAGCDGGVTIPDVGDVDLRVEDAVLVQRTECRVEGVLENNGGQGTALVLFRAYDQQNTLIGVAGISQSMAAGERLPFSLSFSRIVPGPSPISRCEEIARFDSTH